jgi:tRNA pseudouridine38-40 synthase
LRVETEIVGAGRTDTGVHAALMVAHFDTDQDLGDGTALCVKLNSMLPQDIAISRIVEVQADAHARFDAVSRRYEYHIITSKNVFLHGFAARFNENIDFEIMNQAAKILFEYSDFTSFSKLHTDARTNNCVIKQPNGHNGRSVGGLQ